MIYLLKGEHQKCAGRICAWCNSPIRHRDVDPNNGTVEMLHGGTATYIHQLCAVSYFSTHDPKSLNDIKSLIE